jgi:hypothetical protein
MRLRGMFSKRRLQQGYALHALPAYSLGATTQAARLTPDLKIWSIESSARDTLSQLMSLRSLEMHRSVHPR